MPEREPDQDVAAAEFRTDSALEPERIEAMVERFLENPEELGRAIERLTDGAATGELDPEERAYVVTASRIIAEMGRESERDHLTGLRNRRALEGSPGLPGDFVKEAERASREKYDFALVLLDLDQFKRINEKAGHHVGDEVLQKVGDTLKKIGYILRSRLRTSDTAYRFAGDEFGLLLPGVDSEKRAREIVRRLSESFPTDPTTGAPVGVNERMSVAMYRPSEHEPGDTPELLKRAWAALKGDEGEETPA
ncbi:MAG: GGDEF domain-containing protein [bacterium]|nr:GGDEF domain-containing protein [bacterium]